MLTAPQPTPYFHYYYYYHYCYYYYYYHYEVLTWQYSCFRNMFLWKVAPSYFSFHWTASHCNAQATRFRVTKIGTAKAVRIVACTPCFDYWLQFIGCLWIRWFAVKPPKTLIMESGRSLNAFRSLRFRTDYPGFHCRSTINSTTSQLENASLNHIGSTKVDIETDEKHQKNITTLLNHLNCGGLELLVPGEHS